LKAIAGWLEVFVSNIYQTKTRSTSSGKCWRRNIKTMPLLGTALRLMYVGSASLFGSGQQRKMLRFKGIEPYIIEGKVWKKIVP